MKSSKINSKEVLTKNFIGAVIIFLVTIAAWLLFNLMIYRETQVQAADIMNEYTLHDFVPENGRITSTSADPWITLNLSRRQCVKTVEVEITELEGENVIATFYASGNLWIDEVIELSVGMNKVIYPVGWDYVDYLRLDLAQQPGVTMAVGSIYVNRTSVVLINALKEALIMGLAASVLFVLAAAISDNLIHIKKLKMDCIKTGKPTGNKALRLMMKCWLVYSVSIIAIIRADFRYLDDLERTYSGNVADWDIYSRYFSEWLCRFFSMNEFVSDTSPLTQLMTMLMMAAAVTILVWVIAPDKMDSNWIVPATVPFAISPYFMENISYKIECVVHGASVLICVLPLLLYKRRDWLYCIVSACCIILMCITYQGASGIYPVIVVMTASVEWNRGEELKKILRSVLLSVAGYVAGLGIFKLFIMKPIATHVSSEMLPLREIIPGAFHNLLNYYAAICDDFSSIWLGIIMLIMAAFIFVYCLNSKRSKLGAVFMAVITVLVMCCLCFGIYPALKECVFYPRVMYVAGIILSMMCIFIIDGGFAVSKLATVAIAWCFIVFAFDYGNCLAMQQEYTEVRAQAVVDYLNRNYDENIDYRLQMNGFIGMAPAIRRHVNDNKLLGKLIPQTLGGGSCWAEFKLFRYYGLPDNFTVVWSWDVRNDNGNLLKLNLPKKESLMWFDVYGDESNILIQIKN